MYVNHKNIQSRRFTAQGHYWLLQLVALCYIQLHDGRIEWVLWSSSLYLFYSLMKWSSGPFCPRVSTNLNSDPLTRLAIKFKCPYSDSETDTNLKHDFL